MFIQATYWTSASAFHSWMLYVTYVPWNIFKTLSVHNLSVFASFTSFPVALVLCMPLFQKHQVGLDFHDNTSILSHVHYTWKVTDVIIQHLRVHGFAPSILCGDYCHYQLQYRPIQYFMVPDYDCIRWEHKNSSGWADHSNHVAPIFVTSTACRSNLLLAFCLVILIQTHKHNVDRTWS